MSSSKIRRQLLNWYDANARELPWRQTRDPYAIWVSEVMLQQTRVETVIPYYERFVDQFPTPRALAGASEDEVLSLWSGLGYYRRARLLHKGVKEVVDKYGGRVPEAADKRQALPGVGRYTAGAIGSIAFGREEPVVDGNVSRVLARLFYIDGELGRAATERALWTQAQELVKGRRPGALNQAMMELGATVCTARQPKCTACPVRLQCAAHRHRAVGRLPVPRTRKPPRSVRALAVVATRGRFDRDLRLWLAKSEEPLFGGLWGVPLAEVEEGATTADARALMDSVALRGRLTGSPITSIEHTLTHRHYDVTVFRAVGASGHESSTQGWYALRSLGHLGVSRLTDKILRAALASGPR